MGHDLKSAEALDDSILEVFEERRSIGLITTSVKKQSKILWLFVLLTQFLSRGSNAHIDTCRSR